jgi:citrate lyase subunit beta/citryl-CoA lyase
MMMIPKAESREVLSAASAAVPTTALFPLIETAEGVHCANDLARCNYVVRLALGTVDLMLDLGVESDREPLDFARSALVVASRRAGLPSPVDGVCVSIDDEARITDETVRARTFGFGSKLCIHPRQLQPVRAGFRVREDELAWANRVVEASNNSQGAAVSVDGKMIDTPVLLRAKKLIARASLIERR